MELFRCSQLHLPIGSLNRGPRFSTHRRHFSSLKLNHATSTHQPQSQVYPSFISQNQQCARPSPSPASSLLALFPAAPSAPPPATAPSLPSKLPPHPLAFQKKSKRYSSSCRKRARAPSAHPKPPPPPPTPHPQHPPPRPSWRRRSTSRLLRIPGPGRRLGSR